ncbi:MAG: hypothetical protein HY682_04965 [Chloroflexi bacterium]|nr:hypothetical protein [Chloroflexota bacterium]
MLIRIFFPAVALLTWLILVPTASAQGPISVNGGGTGTFGADLDGDGDIDGSQFGLGVTIRATGTAGHFLCAMAGRSDFLGLALMSVEGPVSGGVVNPDGSVTLSGAGTVNLGNGTRFTGVPFVVKVTAGGAGVGSLQLTVIGAFDGVPGDAIVGNGNYDLPVETVASGGIKVH